MPDDSDSARELPSDPLQRHLKRTLVTGVLLLIPVAATVWVLFTIFNWIDAILGGWISQLLGVRVPGLGILATLLLVYFIGLFASNVAGRRIIGLWERWVTRVPLARGVYRVAKELSQAFEPGRKRPFEKVVLVEFPRRGVWTIGFLSADAPADLPAPEGSSFVFVPTTPNPTSGWLIIVPKEDLHVTPYSVDEGMRIVISAGIVTAPTRPAAGVLASGAPPSV
jgi:uncharacterized membrane protein